MPRRISVIFFVFLLFLIILLSIVFLVNFEDNNNYEDNYEDDFYSDREVIYQNGVGSYLIKRIIDEDVFDIEENIVESQINDKYGGKEIIYECVDDSGCNDDFISENYCFFGKVYRDSHYFSCNVKCNEDIERELIEKCDLSCEDGQCVNFFEFDCTEDYECAINDFVGDRFCQGDDVYQNYKTWTCENPGTEDSICSFNKEVKIVDECNLNLICSEGMCVDE